jgi:hypothetical protein
MPKVIGSSISGMALLAIDMFFFAPDAVTRYFGLFFAIPVTTYAFRGFRMATIVVLPSRLVVRTLWRTYRLPWVDIRGFEVWETGSGYGGHRYSICAMCNSGRIVRFGEFWSPGSGNVRFPDCGKIATELEAYRNHLTMTAGAR